MVLELFPTASRNIKYATFKGDEALTSILSEANCLDLLT